MDVAAILVPGVVGIGGSLILAWVVVREIRKSMTSMASTLKEVIKDSLREHKPEPELIKPPSILPGPDYNHPPVPKPLSPDDVEKRDREKQLLLNKIVEEQRDNSDLRARVKALERQILDVKTEQHREREVYATNKENADKRLKEVIKSYQAQIKQIREEMGQ